MLSLVTAVIKPFAVDLVREALQSMEVPGLTVSAVMGFGRQGGHTETYRGTEYAIDFVPKVKVEVVVPTEHGRGWSPTGSGRWPDPARSATARSGSPTVEQVVRIRTGERGVDADLSGPSPPGQIDVRNLSDTGHDRAMPLARRPATVAGWERPRSTPVRHSACPCSAGPADAHVREHLATFRQPRILLVEPGVTPPVLLDELEDWMRTPADPDDLRARSRELHRRALDAAPASPTIDDQGLLWVGRSWVDLTPAQAPVVALLVEHLERVVRYDAVGATYESAGGSSHAASLRTLLTRIGSRVRPVGLELVTVRRRGVLLTQRPRARDCLAGHAHGEAPAEAAPARDRTGPDEVADAIDLLGAELGAVLIGDLEPVDHQTVVGA